MNLNEQQIEAIDSPYPQTVVIAGPGSGKTATLSGRIAATILRGADPAGLVAITFTNAAGREIAERVRAKVGDKPLGYIGTIHAYALRILRAHGDCLGLPPAMAVMDETQADELLQQTAEQLHYKGTQKALGEAVDALLAVYEGRGTAPLGPDVASLVAYEYLTRQLNDGMLSFDAIIAFALQVKLIRATADKLGGAVTQLLVDEYQDCNDTLHNLCMAHVCTKFFVGDPDQGIYRFNGGNVQNMVRLAQDPLWRCYVLDNNYRSTPEICEAADRLIVGNRNRVAKQLKPVGMSALVCDRWPVGFVQAATPAGELSCVAEDLREGLKQGRSCAVLCRTNYIAQGTGIALEGAGLPVRRKERVNKPPDWGLVRRFLPLAANPDNDTLAYLFLSATRGQRYADKVRLEAAEASRSINFHLLKMPKNLDLHQVPDVLAKINVTPDSLAIVKAAIVGLAPEANVAELAIALGNPELHYREVGDANAITVTTIHAAKGREWDWVFVLGADDEVIPGKVEGADLSEERRVMFVAVTRARERLTVTTSALRKRGDWMMQASPAIPSRFCYELGIVR